eukprot:NODE_137_length_18042_cov_0.768823.p14 type:complete len:114 gc:universal NODE_137_length_18042_cov_0.768823:17616-17957(+)
MQTQIFEVCLSYVLRITSMNHSFNNLKYDMAISHVCLKNQRPDTKDNADKGISKDIERRQITDLIKKNVSHDQVLVYHDTLQGKIVYGRYLVLIKQYDQAFELFLTLPECCEF